MPKQSEEHIEIWNKYISLFDIKLKDYSPKIYDTDYCAVIVELREHPDFEVIVKNVMYFLNESGSDIKWGLKIYHGTNNKQYVKNIVKDWENVHLENLNLENLDIQLYNDLFKSTKFWKSLPCNNILIFQTDSVMLRFGIDEFLQYTYVGAPWHRYREGVVVGNGGFSFRKRNKMLEIINEYDVNSIIQEDIYFSKYLKEEDVPNLQISKRFSVEDVYYKNPLGIHQPKIEYDKLESILNNGLNNIKL